MHRAVCVPISNADGSLVLSADLQSNGKQNQVAKTLGRNKAVVDVLLRRLQGLELAGNERARQGKANAASRAQGTDMEAKEKKKPNQT